MKLILASLAAGLTLVACSPKTAPVAETVETLEFPNETVSNGYALYGEQCTKCHKAKEVKKYTREDWDGILPRMAKKAGIDATQEATINEYINWELGR